VSSNFEAASFVSFFVSREANVDDFVTARSSQRYRRRPQQIPENILNTFTAVSSWISSLLQDGGSGGGPKP
jgi:hypothetical protein